MTQPTLATLPTEPSARLKTIPPTIGRFQVQGEIGRGSNGVVYAAHDPVLGRDVALKVVALTDDPTFRDQIEAGFLNEAKAAAGVNHPNIVTVFDAGKADRLAYIAMERLHGRDLHDLIVSGQRMSYRQIAGLMARVADAVHFAHKHGLVHRDIKPSNVFVLRDGKPKVLDFGVAMGVANDPSATHRRQLIGTPNYMSPEQALGRRLDPRSDVFSLGTILYELIGRRRAFEGKTVEETLAQVISDTPMSLAELRSDLPRELLEIVERSLEKDVDRRFQTAGELRNALAAFAESSAGASGSARATRATAAGPASLWQRIRAEPGAAIAMGAAGLAVAIAIGFIVAGRGERASSARTGPAQAEAPAPQAGTSSTAGAPSEGAKPGDAASPPRAGDAQAAVDTEARAAKVAPSRRAARPTPPPAAPPPAEGFVALAVAPWGEVFVNGQLHGVAPPLSRITLAPGVYEVEIRNRAAAPYRARVEVKPGQTVSLQHRF